jgi:hypothetical protein
MLLAPDGPCFGLREMGLRKSTWVVLGWTAGWLVLYGLWAINPDPIGVHGAATTGVPIVGPTKPYDWQLFDYWFIGFVVLSAVWLLTRWRRGRRGKS